MDRTCGLELALRYIIWFNSIQFKRSGTNSCIKVAAWKLRGNLPHPVEATALLTDAILHDDARKNSIFSIRATYSAAFCR